MKPDGSSGKRPNGEGIPNIDSVKKTIYTRYGDPGTGIADKTASPDITDWVRALVPPPAGQPHAARPVRGRSNLNR